MPLVESPGETVKVVRCKASPLSRRTAHCRFRIELAHPVFDAQRFPLRVEVHVSRAPSPEQAVLQIETKRRALLDVPVTRLTVYFYPALLYSVLNFESMRPLFDLTDPAILRDDRNVRDAMARLRQLMVDKLAEYPAIPAPSHASRAT